MWCDLLVFGGLGVDGLATGPHLHFALDVLHLVVQRSLFLDHHVALSVVRRTLHQTWRIYMQHIATHTPGSRHLLHMFYQVIVTSQKCVIIIF